MNIKAKYSVFKGSKTQGGTSLLEVMVSLLLFSVGMLGFVGLQGAAMRTAQQSNMHTRAMVQIADIIARMRANPEAVANGDYGDTTTSESEPGSTPTPVKNCLTATTACSSTELAKHDLSVWGASTAQWLPSGKGLIQAVSGEPTQLTVSLVWLQALDNTTSVSSNTTDGSDSNNSNCAYPDATNRSPKERAYCVTINLARM